MPVRQTKYQGHPTQNSSEKSEWLRDVEIFSHKSVRSSVTVTSERSQERERKREFPVSMRSEWIGSNTENRLLNCRLKLITETILVTSLKQSSDSITSRSFRCRASVLGSDMVCNCKVVAALICHHASALAALRTHQTLHRPLSMALLFDLCGQCHQTSTKSKTHWPVWVRVKPAAHYVIRPRYSIASQRLSHENTALFRHSGSRTWPKPHNSLSNAASRPNAGWRKRTEPDQLFSAGRRGHRAIC